MPIDKRTAILVVDDERSVVSLVEESLRSDAVKISTFTDPAEALVFIGENKVDLVLTDMMMGEYTGVQIIDAVTAEHPDAVSILMTGNPTVETAISVLKRGAYDFLVKPFKLEILKASVERGLQHQKLTRENLQLRGRIDFLKVATAAGAGNDVDGFLDTVIKSCKHELNAIAAGLIEADPKTRTVLRSAHETDEPELVDKVLDPATLTQFNNSKNHRPIVVETSVEEDDRRLIRSFISQPIFVRRQLYGVINLIVVTRYDSVAPSQLDLLSILANSAASAIVDHRGYQNLQQSYHQAISGLANAIEARDAHTAGHTERVCKLAELVATKLGWMVEQIQNLRMGCALHDIGKLGVPDAILNKEGKLTPEEIRQMRRHPEVGLQIISGIDFFKPAIPYIISHHEWYNGQGYPHGLKGTKIPIEGRLLAVVDTFDAILSDRPYRKGRNAAVAISELVSHKGIQFDPGIVDTFLTAIEESREALGKWYGPELSIPILTDVSATEKVQA